MERLTELLEKLANELGTTTKYLWSVLIKQARIEIIEWAVMAIIFVAFFIPLNKYIRWIFKNWETICDNDHEPAHLIISGLLGICLLIYGIAILCNIPNVIDAIFNPEYWALKQVLGIAN